MFRLEQVLKWQANKHGSLVFSLRTQRLRENFIEELQDLKNARMTAGHFLNFSRTLFCFIVDQFHF